MLKRNTISVRYDCRTIEIRQTRILSLVSCWALLAHVAGGWAGGGGVTLGMQRFLDTYMLVSATPKSCVGGFAQSKPQHARGFQCSGIFIALQLFIYNNVSTFKTSNLIVGSIQGFVLNRKLTLSTVCTYEQHLQTIFIELFPEKNNWV